MILFSDWTSEDPHQVLRSLKRGSEWYAIEKGSGQSIIGAARMGMLDEYFKREFQRMPAMDIADVAYDYFLANGRPETSLRADVEKTLRLRLINGSATTYFHLEFAGGPMTIVSADGLAVQPVEQQRFLIAVAETYDVMVKIPNVGSYELRATAHDGSGYASVWIGSGRRIQAPEVPKPNLYQSMHHGDTASVLSLTPAGAMGMPDSRVKAGEFDQPGMTGMKGMHMEEGRGMSHTEHAPKTEKNMQHDMPVEHDKHKLQTAKSDHEITGHSAHLPKTQESARGGKKFTKNFRPLASDVSSMPEVAADGVDPRRPWPPYAKLRSVQPTAFDRDKPVREIRLTLDGDMERYVWFLNNKTLSESDLIRIREGGREHR